MAKIAWQKLHGKNCMANCMAKILGKLHGKNCMAKLHDKIAWQKLHDKNCMTKIVENIRVIQVEVMSTRKTVGK